MALMNAGEYLVKVRRKVRWMLGKGYGAFDFDSRYRRNREDAWGYSGSDVHGRRHELILNAIPQQNFESGFEAGCAEGHLSRLLATRVNRLVATDISEIAIQRARVRNADLLNVTFIAGDVRERLSLDAADLLVFSDVLYYLSKSEVQGVIAACSKIANNNCILLFANEWLPHYRNMSSPQVIMDVIESTGGWRKRSVGKIEGPADSSLTVASYERESAF